MKHIKAFLLFLTLAVSSIAAGPIATFGVDFTHDSEDPNIEYVVEEKNVVDGAVTWVEVGKGPKSPIVFTRHVNYGNYEIRVYWRVAGVARNTSVDTSQPASTVVIPIKPYDVKIGRQAANAVPPPSTSTATSSR